MWDFGWVIIAIISVLLAVCNLILIIISKFKCLHVWMVFLSMTLGIIMVIEALLSVNNRIIFGEIVLLEKNIAYMIDMIIIIVCVIIAVNLISLIKIKKHIEK